jgi:tRNA-specific adenosine deaminase 1
MTVFDAVSISSHHSQPLADLITSTSIELFDQLPRHGKPTIRANGRHEWTILATISLVIHSYVELTPGIELIESTRVLPISLGTGVKVLPATKLPPVGDTIHDSHAEILARRGLVRWLIEESRRVARGTENEDVIEWYNGKFRLKEGVQTWLYVSALPVSFLVLAIRPQLISQCGDASTLHTALHQDAEMAAIKALEEVPEHAPGAAVRGRNGYENYGAIRTKPGRADSPPTISFSCSDKIATWSVLGLQGAMLEPLFDPVYLTGVVIGGVNEYGPDGQELRKLIRPEIQRAIWGRLEQLQGMYSGTKG